MGIEGEAGALDGLREVVVERREDVAGLRVVARLELAVLPAMAARTVARAHDDGYRGAVVVESVGPARLGAMAVEAADRGPRVEKAGGRG
jgi:hypothetical protein